MPNSSSVTPWTLQMPAGSLQQWNFTFTEVSSTTGQLIPYPISGATWEYVARPTPTDLTSPALIDITTASTSEGQIIVTSTAMLSQAQLTILPAATVSLTPGTYAHTLWMNPGSTSAVTWVTGQLLIVGNPQP